MHHHPFIGISIVLFIGIELLFVQMTKGMPQPCVQCVNNNNKNAPSPPRQNGGNNGEGGQCQPSSQFDQSNGCFQGAHFDPNSQSCVPPSPNCQAKNRLKSQNGNVNGNANRNGNQNGNENQNANANANQNQNANSNANRNQNANSNSADNTNNNLNNNNINIGTRVSGK